MGKCTEKTEESNQKGIHDIPSQPQQLRYSCPSFGFVPKSVEAESGRLQVEQASHSGVCVCGGAEWGWLVIALMQHCLESNTDGSGILQVAHSGAGGLLAPAAAAAAAGTLSIEGIPPSSSQAWQTNRLAPRGACTGSFLDLCSKLTTKLDGSTSPRPFAAACPSDEWEDGGSELVCSGAGRKESEGIGSSRK